MVHPFGQRGFSHAVNNEYGAAEKASCNLQPMTFLYATQNYVQVLITRPLRET